MDQEERDSGATPGEESRPEVGATPGEGAWDLLRDPPPSSRGALGPPGSGLPPQALLDGSAVPWSGRDVFAILGLVVLSFIAALFFIQAGLAAANAIVPDFDPAQVFDSGLTVALLLVLQWVITLAVPLTYMKTRGYRLNLPVLGFRRTSIGKALLWLILILVLTGVFQNLYGALIESLFGSGELPSQVPSQDVTTLFGSSILAAIVTFLAVAIITPVVEELFFRGIIHRGLEQAYGFVPGAIMSSIIFALAHIDYRLYAPIFVLGFGFAFLVHRTGSIWPSIGGHFVINALGVIAQFVDLGNGQ